MIKTNAARLLDAAGIGYELIPYEFSEDDLSAGKVAASLGEDVERVFKTLVLRGDRNGVFVCVIPGDFEVDLKLAASISGNKSCAMVHVKELLGLTGYIRGGCSPIGMKKAYPTFIQATPARKSIRSDLPCLSYGGFAVSADFQSAACLCCLGECVIRRFLPPAAISIPRRREEPARG